MIYTLYVCHKSSFYGRVHFLHSKVVELSSSVSELHMQMFRTSLKWFVLTLGYRRLVTRPANLKVTLEREIVRKSNQAIANLFNSFRNVSPVTSCLNENEFQIKYEKSRERISNTAWQRRMKWGVMGGVAKHMIRIKYKFIRPRRNAASELWEK